MKKLKLFSYSFLLIAMLMMACHEKRNELVDSWKITAVEAKTTLSDSVKNEILTKGTLTFTKDGHVNGFLESEINDGTYALTKKGKNLVIKDENGTPFSFESDISDDEVILVSDKMKLTLTKK
ncbi:hypothetical protein [Flavobacterium daejeonense]|uniref:hypothetical protein n=1 Tax=Flavobacterium daejeonense TaxID=350893 RepID=UPI00047A1D39|nr:hypothetical protein [Flavobacterium daejeonense]